MLIANVILARLLTPDDFGLLALIAIFIQISQTFIDAGFSNALIQKKDRTQTDFSTVFFFNLAISVFFYIILYFASPLIADFFKSPQLVSLIRVIGLNLVIGAFATIHRTRLTINLQFKLQSTITLCSALISVTVAILLAYQGYGVWALVSLSFINIGLQTILFNIIIRWHPSITFSIKAFKQLFGYSSKLLGANLINLLYKNVYPIIIGKKFTPIELGYFNRADTFAQYPPVTIGAIISRVAFPIFSKLQDNNEKLEKAYSKYIIYASLMIFPLLIGLLVLARPLTILILKEKWLPMVPMLQILCLDWMTEHISSINLNVLYVKGRSDLALRLEIIKKIIAFSIFLISLKWGIIGVCWGRVMYGIIAIFLNSYYTKNLIGVSIGKQLMDITKPLTYALIMGIIVYFYSIHAQFSLAINTVSAIILGIVIYFLIIRFASTTLTNEIIELTKSVLIHHGKEKN